MLVIARRTKAAMAAATIIIAAQVCQSANNAFMSGNGIENLKCDHGRKIGQDGHVDKREDWPTVRVCFAADNGQCRNALGTKRKEHHDRERDWQRK